MNLYIRYNHVYTVLAQGDERTWHNIIQSVGTPLANLSLMHWDTDDFFNFVLYLGKLVGVFCGFTKIC
jgi:hypothetical protein